mgnify:CR=1 FL=1
MIFMAPVALKLPPQARQDDAGRLNQEKFMDMQAITEALRAKVVAGQPAVIYSLIPSVIPS